MARFRRLRRRRVSPELHQRILARVAEVGAMQERVDELQANIKAMMELVETDMRAANLDKIESGVYEAVHEEPQSRSSTYIKPQELYKKLGPDEFFACVKVLVKEVTEYLSGKELEKLKTVVPAEKKDPVLKIRRIARHLGG